MKYLKLSDNDFVLSDDSGFVAEVKNLFSDKDQLRCFLRITFGSATVFSATHNFFSVRGEQEFVKYMQEHKEYKMDWKRYYCDLKETLIEAYFDAEGEVMDIKDIEASDVKYYLYPYIAVGQNNVLYAHGGTGKSTFAIALAYSLFHKTEIVVDYPNVEFKGNILYLDYETDKAGIKSIYNRVCEKEIPKGRFFYKREDVPLKNNRGLKKLLLSKNIKLLIIDSIGLAAGGNLKDEEEAINFFVSLRKLGVTPLLITHKNKSADESQKGASMFGSVYFYNYARNIFELESEGDTLKVVHKKCNFNRLEDEVRFYIVRENGKIRYTLRKGDIDDEF